MIIIMPILSQAYENAKFLDGISFKCGGKCLVECLPKIESKIKYTLCIVSCYAQCNKISLDTTYNCLNDCDSLEFIDINYGTYIFYFLYNLFYIFLSYFV